MCHHSNLSMRLVCLHSPHKAMQGFLAVKESKENTENTQTLWKVLIVVIVFVLPMALCQHLPWASTGNTKMRMLGLENCVVLMLMKCCPLCTHCKLDCGICVRHKQTHTQTHRHIDTHTDRIFIPTTESCATKPGRGIWLSGGQLRGFAIIALDLGTHTDGSGDSPHGNDNNHSLEPRAPGCFVPNKRFCSGSGDYSVWWIFGLRSSWAFRHNLGLGRL